MRKENYKIKHKCLLGIFIISMLIFSEPLYSQNNIIPSNLRKSLYKLYHYNTTWKSTISKLSCVEGKKHDGVYTFRLNYQPHYPTRVFFISNNTPYTIESLGFENTTAVLLESCHFLSSKHQTNSYIKSILSGVYKYLFAEYGLTYGSDFFDKKPDLTNERDKMRFIIHRVNNVDKLRKQALYLRTDRKIIPDSITNYIKGNNLNDEEALLFLRYIILNN